MYASSPRARRALRTLSASALALALLASLPAALVSADTSAHTSGSPSGSTSAAQPTQAAACLPQIRDGWVRLPPGKMPMMAGFGRIVNPCATPATVVSASSPSFADVELHETKLIDGVSRMRHVPELRIRPDDSAVLKPGGLHLMLMRPAAELSPGSRVAVTFTLADGRTLIGEFEVRKAAP